MVLVIIKKKGGDIELEKHDTTKSESEKWFRGPFPLLRR